MSGCTHWGWSILQFRIARLIILSHWGLFQKKKKLRYRSYYILCKNALYFHSNNTERGFIWHGLSSQCERQEVVRENYLMDDGVSNILLRISWYPCTWTKNVNQFYLKPLLPNLIWTENKFRDAIRTSHGSSNCNYIRTKATRDCVLTSAVTFVLHNCKSWVCVCAIEWVWRFWAMQDSVYNVLDGCWWNTGPYSCAASLLLDSSIYEGYCMNKNLWERRNSSRDAKRVDGNS